MKEQHLVIASVIVLVIGIAFLLLYAEEADLIPPARLEENSETQYVQITGTIKEVRSQKNVSFLQVDGQRKEVVDVILFPKEELFLHEGDEVTIEGVLEEYNGKKEIIAHNIIITSGIFIKE